MYEAQQAFFYGLPYNLAIASVTSNAAEVLGMGHRLGYIREGTGSSLSCIVKLKNIHRLGRW